ncbi:aryl-alcohol dehydrogenase [Panaeolus papilionaceus]|nr:aryl-alcohol dehydrogenase [Panaeolus papilionaceus]
MSDNKRRMPYVRLGTSGLKVSKIILGTMQYGHNDWQKWVLGEKEAIEHIKYAQVLPLDPRSIQIYVLISSPSIKYRYEAGIQTFDTANVYSNGLSEVILGKAIKELKLPRDEIVVMTKVFGVVAREYGTNMITTGGDPEELGYVNQRGLSRKHIFESVKHSLERLQLDYIDVLQCHRFDNNTPIEETMQALHDVVQAGYVRYIGMSSCWAWQYYAIQNKLTPFISMQNHHSLLYREEEREMLPTIKHFGVGCIPWSPLARGLLTRPLSDKTTRGDTDYFIGKYTQAEGTEEILKRVEELANKKGVSMAQIAIAWSLQTDGVTAPIVGTTSLKNLEDIISAVHLKLSPEDMEYLQSPYKPQEVIGHA